MQMKTLENLLQVKEIITDCLLKYRLFREHCKMISIDLSKEQACDANPRAI